MKVVDLDRGITPPSLFDPSDQRIWSLPVKQNPAGRSDQAPRPPSHEKRSHDAHRRVILMTALTAGFALVPLVLAAGAPGNEIQSPMAQVILGGLLTSTFLNLVVVPVLYLRMPVRSEEG